MNNRAPFLTLSLALSGLLAACATQPAPTNVAVAEPLEHEYRTGSLIPVKDKHVTTDAERAGAAQAVHDLGVMPVMGDPANNRAG